MQEITEYYSKQFLTQHGENLANALSQLAEANLGLIARLKGLSTQQLQQPVTADKWSPTQIGEHVVMINGFLAKAIIKAIEHQHNPNIRRFELPKGYITADGRNIDPSGREMPNQTDCEVLCSQLIEAEKALAAAGKAAEAADILALDCMKQPFFGWITCLETLQMAAWHIRHHTRQF
jgi:hypothetical protein